MMDVTFKVRARSSKPDHFLMSVCGSWLRISKDGELITLQDTGILVCAKQKLISLQRVIVGVNQFSKLHFGQTLKK